MAVCFRHLSCCFAFLSYSAIRLQSVSSGPGGNSSVTIKPHGKCSCKKLTIIAIITPLLVISTSVGVGYGLTKVFRKVKSGTGFSIQEVVHDSTIDDGLDWVVIQRRKKGNVNFTRTWEEYKNGFGSLTGDFWFGNDNIHTLTQQGYNRLAIKLTTFEGSSYSVEYGYFSLQSEEEEYRLTISGYNPGYSGIKRDCMVYHNGKTFSTYDRDNESKCASFYSGGWWYDFCQEANLNGRYRTGRSYEAGEVKWCYIDKNSGIKYTQMMIKKTS